jgi:predicted esterase
VIALHGYGSHPEAMLRLTLGMVGAGHLVASIQGPNQFYPAPVGDPNNTAAVYNWGTSAHPALNIRLHHDMVKAVLSDVRGRFGIPPKHCVLCGFSQPVGLNYRFAGTWPGEIGGVIGICGGVPKDWEEDKYRTVDAPILHIAREQDEFYPADVSRGFADRLRRHATDVEFHLLPGGHRFPSKARVIAEPWLKRIGAGG